MEQGYDAVWGGEPGVCGIYRDGQLVVSASELHRLGYDTRDYVAASPARLAAIHREAERFSQRKEAHRGSHRQ